MQKPNALPDTTTNRRVETLIGEDGQEADCYVIEDLSTSMTVQVIETGQVLELKKFVQ